MVVICVVTALLVSEGSVEGHEGVAEVSVVLVAKVEVGEVVWDGEWVTELLTELGEVTSGVAADVACVTGSVVSQADIVVMCVGPEVNSFVLESDTEGRTPFVVEVRALLVPGEEGIGEPEARVPVGVTEEVVGGAEGVCVWGDSVVRSV